MYTDFEYLLSTTPMGSGGHVETSSILFYSIFFRTGMLPWECSCGKETSGP